MAKCAQCGRQLPAFALRKICEWCVRHEAAQRGEEDEDAIQPVMPVPWAQGISSAAIVTQAFFAINLMVFAAMALEGIAMNPSSRQLIQWGANFGPYTLGGQEWRLLSCTFLHIGLMHIFFNMWCLWDLGAMCEGLFGHATFAAVYLISGVGASLASVWWRPVGVSAGAWLHRSRSYLIHAQRGQQFLEENKLDQAVAELQTATRQHPDYLPAHFALAHAYFNNRQFDLAEAELKRVLELHPGHGGAQYELGMVYLNQKRLPEAKDRFTALLGADKEDGYAHLGLGMTLAAEQNYLAAIEEYKAAAELEPDLESVFYRLGVAQAKQKDYDAAIAAFHTQQQKAGDDIDTENALAEAYRAKGMAHEAEEAMRKAQQLKPSK